MIEDVHIPFTQIRIGRFLFLLVSLLMMFALRPFLEDFIGVNLLMEIFFTVVLISGIYAVSWRKRIFYTSMLIAFAALAPEWLNLFISMPALVLVGKVFGSFFYFFVVTVILSYLFKEDVITGDMIIGSICVYLLIGMMWASLFSLLETVQPGSFRLPESAKPGLNNFPYYSFVTLTTLGYGDITPITTPARSLSILEAIMGQLYIAILITRFVGIHISQFMEKKYSEPERQKQL